MRRRPPRYRQVGDVCTVSDHTCTIGPAGRQVKSRSVTFRLHVVSLPHTETTREYEWCAYTARVRRFCTMMTNLGYHVTLYAGEANEADVAEHVACICRDQQARYFGEGIPEFDASAPGWQWFNRNAAAGIRRRAQPGDFLCLSAGSAHEAIWQPVAPANVVPIEPFVGYGGVMQQTHRAFESYAWMHTVYGATMGAHGADGRYFDTVIPNSYDPDDFPLGTGQGDYLLYVGRLTERKGLDVVAEVARRVDIPLVVAGGGDLSLIPPGADYRGVVGPQERAELMGNARALICPTRYVGPFEGVHVEAQLCGTPVITTDWGVFTETVDLHGLVGWRCRTLAEFCTAVEAARIPAHHREVIRRMALMRWSTEVAALQYDAWFKQLATLQAAGWYEGAPPVR